MTHTLNVLQLIKDKKKKAERQKQADLYNVKRSKHLAV